MGREFKYLWVLKGNCENVILAKDAREEIIYYEMVHVQNLNYFPGLQPLDLLKNVLMAL